MAEFKGAKLVQAVCEFFPEPDQTICSCMLTKSFTDAIAAVQKCDIYELLEAEREIGMERPVLERLAKREIKDKDQRAGFLSNIGIFDDDLDGYLEAALKGCKFEVKPEPAKAVAKAK